MHLLRLWNSIQDYLFPVLELGLDDELTKKEKEFIKICELSELDLYLDRLRWLGIGRRPSDRLAILKAFTAKAVYNFSTTRQLLCFLESSDNLRRLCGWESKGDIPHECTFSRGFTLISELELPQKIYEQMIKKNLGNHLVGHISRDSTAIHAREKIVTTPPETEGKLEKKPAKRGRPKKGEVRPPKPQTRLEKQPSRTLDENLADLPTVCNKGTKRNSKGYKVSWKGYKLHLDCADGDIPVSAILTSASVHDSQAAIPLAQMTAQRVTNLYDLMDSAYDAEQIHSFSRKLDHVPLIDQNKRKNEKIPFPPAESQRYKQRSSAERVNSNLKDNYGGNSIRVRGHKKVMCHLMFGLIALTANQIFNLLH